MNRPTIMLAVIAAMTASMVVTCLPAFAQEEPVTRVDPSRFRHLDCDQIARRIQALNVPIAENNSTIAGVERSLKLGTTLEFLLLGTGSRTPEFNAKVAEARGERNALIAVAVEKNCAAKRLLPTR